MADRASDITLTFAEALRKDADGAELADADLAAILTLKTGDENGTAIDFSASINAAKTVITIDPDSDLADGDVYVEISAEHYDEAGNQGAKASATFTVDTSVAAPAFSPADGARVKDAAGNITLTFAEAVSKDADGTDFDAAGLEAVLTLKTGDENGTDIDFSAAINAAKTVITIDPDSDLADGDVYVEISAGYFDGQGNQGTARPAPPSASTPPHRRRRPSARPTATGWPTGRRTSP